MLCYLHDSCNSIAQRRQPTAAAASLESASQMDGWGSILVHSDVIFNKHMHMHMRNASALCWPAMHVEEQHEGISMAASLRMREILKLPLLRKEPVYCVVVNRYADPDATNFLISGGYQKRPSLPVDCYILLVEIAPFPPSPQTRDKLVISWTFHPSFQYLC